MADLQNSEQKRRPHPKGRRPYYKTKKKTFKPSTEVEVVKGKSKNDRSERVERVERKEKELVNQTSLSITNKNSDKIENRRSKNADNKRKNANLHQRNIMLEREIVREIERLSNVSVDWEFEV